MNLWNGLMVYGAVLTVMSVITLIAFAWDKRRARKNGWRIKERTLHTLELLGGWPGAWLAMRWLRHKSVKKSYRRVFALVVAIHVLGLVVSFWWAFKD